MAEKEKGKSFHYQWYPKDILTSTRVAAMDLKEEGAYRRALDFCWLSDNIPSDPRKLAKIIGKGCTSKLAELVLTMFIPDPINEGFMVHERLILEKKRQDKWSEKSSNGGKKSAALRMENNTNQTLTKHQPNANETPTTVEEKEQGWLENGTNQNATYPLPVTRYPIHTSSEDDDKPPSSSSERLKKYYPNAYLLLAKNGGIPEEKVNQELLRFDQHHVDTAFTDNAHIHNCWRIWCQNYSRKLTDDFKKIEQVISKPKFNAAKRYYH